jgi:hypothetical protein
MLLLAVRALVAEVLELTQCNTSCGLLWHSLSRSGKASRMVVVLSGAVA